MKHTRYIGLFVLILLLPLLALYSQCPSTSTTGEGGYVLPAWPDASTYWGVILNSGSELAANMTAHPANFRQDYLVTDFEITPVDYTQPTAIPAASATLNNTLSMLTARGIAMGTYISGTNVEPFAHQDRYPFSIVRQEDMPPTFKSLGNWGASAPWRLFVDPGDAPTMTAFHSLIAADWAKVPSGIKWRFVDNSANLEGGLAYGAWPDQMANIHAINLLAQSQGARAIFNMGIVVGALSPANMNLLLSAAAGAGICIEGPWPSSMSTSPANTESARLQYRQLLDADIGVVMIGASGIATNQATSAQLKTWVGTWRKPTDHLYMARADFLAPDPTILNWP